MINLIRMQQKGPVEQMYSDSHQGDIRVETDIGEKRAVRTLEAKTYLRPKNSIQAKWRVKF